MMQRLNPLSAIALVVVAATGCQPEVLIASSGPGAAGTGGLATAGTSAAGTSTGGAGGTGEMPSAGEGGTAVIMDPPRLLADSVADFSFTQGEHGWWYAYDSGTFESFTLMTRQGLVSAYVPPSKDVWKGWVSDTARWTQIFQLGAHPNGTISSMPTNSVLQRAVRRWVSTYAGEVTISGEIAKIDLVGSNGVDAFIYVDGEEVYKTPIAGDDGGGRIYEFRQMLKLDSKVDFVLDPHESEDHHDLSRFTGIIVRVE
jgi:hypothetical protein